MCPYVKTEVICTKSNVICTKSNAFWIFHQDSVILVNIYYQRYNSHLDSDLEYNKDKMLEMSALSITAN